MALRNALSLRSKVRATFYQNASGHIARADHAFPLLNFSARLEVRQQRAIRGVSAGK